MAGERGNPIVTELRGETMGYEKRGGMAKGHGGRCARKRGMAINFGALLGDAGRPLSPAIVRPHKCMYCNCQVAGVGIDDFEQGGVHLAPPRHEDLLDAVRVAQGGELVLDPRGDERRRQELLR